jgi:hypothetical protein
MAASIDDTKWHFFEAFRKQDTIELALFFQFKRELDGTFVTMNYDNDDVQVRPFANIKHGISIVDRRDQMTCPCKILSM